MLRGSRFAASVSMCTLILCAIISLIGGVAIAQGDESWIYEHVYIWRGLDSSGSGALDNWENYANGDYHLVGDGVNPPVKTMLQPHAFDELRIYSFDDETSAGIGPVSIGGGTLNVPDGNLAIEIGGTISGGTWNAGNFSARPGGNYSTEQIVPLTIVGTSVTSNNRIQARATAARLTLDGVTLTGPKIHLAARGSKAFLSGMF